jgi:hypothetical protein
MKLSLFAFVAFTSLAIAMVGCAQAQEPRWYIVGSAGTVDEEDLGQVDLTNGRASIKADVLSGTVEIRYHVLAPPNTNSPGRGLILRALFIDNGRASRVVARLRGMNPATGAETELAVIDSNTQSPSPQPQTVTTNSCNVVDDPLRAFYVDVVLSKTPGGGNPAILMLTVAPIGCAPL